MGRLHGDQESDLERLKAEGGEEWLVLTRKLRGGRVSCRVAVASDDVTFNHALLLSSVDIFVERRNQSTTMSNNLDTTIAISSMMGI